MIRESTVAFWGSAGEGREEWTLQDRSDPDPAARQPGMLEVGREPSSGARGRWCQVVVFFFFFFFAGRRCGSSFCLEGCVGLDSCMVFANHVVFLSKPAWFFPVFMIGVPKSRNGEVTTGSGWASARQLIANC